MKSTTYKLSYLVLVFLLLMAGTASTLIGFLNLAVYYLGLRFGGSYFLFTNFTAVIIGVILWLAVKRWMNTTSQAAAKHKEDYH